ncbi:MAG: CAAX prenyl protease-related protein [Planctomycetota bacterium]
MTADAPTSQKTPITAKPPLVDYGPSDPWAACLIPMVVFLGMGLIEPAKEPKGLAVALGITYDLYPVLYAIRVAVTLLLVWRAWPSIRSWLGRPTWWPPIFGALLVAPWVWLSVMQRDGKWLSGDTGRVGFDPVEFFGGDTNSLWAYLILRGIGLVIVVPIVEELFLRGFLLRFVIRENFWNVPFGAVTPAVLATCALYAIGSHPAEAVAAIVWFFAVTWVCWQTKRPIDAITLHAATNLALGAYLLKTGDWWLL